MVETLEKVGGNVESLDQWRELRDEAPTKVAELLADAHFDTLDATERVEVLKALLAEYAATEGESTRPLHNQYRYIARGLREKLDLAENAAKVEAQVAKQAA